MAYVYQSHRGHFVVGLVDRYGRAREQPLRSRVRTEAEREARELEHHERGMRAAMDLAQREADKRGSSLGEYVDVYWTGKQD